MAEPISSSQLLAEVSCKNNPDGLMLSAFLLADGCIRTENDIVSLLTSRQERTIKDDSVQLSLTPKTLGLNRSKVLMPTISFDLDRMDSEINAVVFVVHTNAPGGLDSFQDVEFCMTSGCLVEAEASLPRTGDKNVDCFVVGNIAKYAGKWTFNPELEAKSGGLEAAFDDYTDASFRASIPFHKIAQG